jgi:rhodanese-related sulfurtransferase
MSLGSELPMEISVEDTHQLLNEDPNVVLLDCREAAEYETAKIEGSTLIPMSGIQQRLEEARALSDRRVIVHCHHGGRSLRVAEWLISQGFPQVQNMTGGIDAWSLQVDSTIPRY